MLENGTPCNDQNSCSTDDMCHQGVCTGTLPNFSSDPDNCGGCGNSCSASTGNSNATCEYGVCCVDGQCCGYGQGRPSTCSYPCNPYQCNCYTYGYDCGFLGSDTCYRTVCSACYEWCYYSCCR